MTARRKKPKANGRVKGVRLGPLSPSAAAASRVANLRTGKYARSTYVSPRQALEVRTAKSMRRRLGAEGDAIFRAAREAQTGGGFEAVEEIQALAYTENEITRREMRDKVQETGVLIEEQLFDKDQRPVGVRVKSNPLLEHLAKATEFTGGTADAMRLTKKSRGTGAVEDAQAAFLRRDADLRAGIALRRAELAAGAIDVTPEKKP